MEQRKNPYAEILEEIETGLLEHAMRISDGIAEPYPYTDETFRACLQIFMGGIMWKMWEHEQGGKAEELGNKIRGLVLRYTGIDTHNLYDA